MVRLSEEHRHRISEALRDSWSRRTNRRPSNKTAWEDILLLFQRFKNLGFRLITTEEEWNTNVSKILCVCSNNHEHEYTIAQLKNVKSCSKCRKIKPFKLSKEEKADNLFEQIKNFYNEYEITKIDYTGTRNSKLQFKCKKGHVFVYNNWHRKMKSSIYLSHEICPMCIELNNHIPNRQIDSIDISKNKVVCLYNRLSSTNGNYLSTQMYSDIILYFQWKEFYKNELEKWKDDKFREKLYNNRLKYANKRPEELTNRTILNGIKVAGLCKTFSHFSPLWLKAFIEEFNIKSIYDPCGGWGHRLIASGNLKYIYNDINEIAFDNVIKMSNFLCLKNKEFYNEDAAYIELNDKVDCMFTCPPYLNTEIYTNKGAENLSKDSFDIWWKKVIENSLKVCTKYIAFVVSNSVPNTIKFEIPINLGLTFIREQNLGIKFNHFQRTSKNVKKKESLFIYKVN